MLGNTKISVLALFMVVPAMALAGLLVVDETVPTPIIKPAPVAVKIVPKEVWTAERGSTFRDTLDNWAKKAKWTVVFDMGKADYQLEGPLRFEGSIDEAAAQFVKLYERAEKPLYADISLRQSLIYVTTRK
ncbi:TcpQ domain-containing protein [Undibacterium arcticum]|uniref:TcpQ domain-containing protein n=1 Tax=Undibacterium arcticum TaxID=1762892 RepID=A0ABV7FDA3_9BURK